MDIGAVIPIHCTGNPAFSLRDVGGDPPHQEVPGGVPPLVSEADNLEAPTSTRW